MKASRRTFILTSVGVASTLALGSRAVFADATQSGRKRSHRSGARLATRKTSADSIRPSTRSTPPGGKIAIITILSRQIERCLRALSDVQQQAGGIEGLVQRVCEEGEGLSFLALRHLNAPVERPGAFYFAFIARRCVFYTRVRTR